MQVLLERDVGEVVIPVDGPQAVVPLGTYFLDEARRRGSAVQAAEEVYPHAVAVGRFPQPGNIGIGKAVVQRFSLVFEEIAVHEVDEGAPRAHGEGRFLACGEGKGPLGRQQSQGYVSGEFPGQGVLELDVDEACQAGFLTGRGGILDASVVRGVEDREQTQQMGDAIDGDSLLGDHGHRTFTALHIQAALDFGAKLDAGQQTDKADGVRVAHERGDSRYLIHVHHAANALIGLDHGHFQPLNDERIFQSLIGKRVRLLRIGAEAANDQ